MLSDADIQLLISAFVALVGVLVAWWQTRKKDAVIAVMSDPTGTKPAVQTEVLAEMPARSWKMSKETLDWLCFGEAQADQDSIREQVRQAELALSLAYTINYSRGGYRIEYGLTKSSWRS